jgi:hypothetical protein
VRHRVRRVRWLAVDPHAAGRQQRREGGSVAARHSVDQLADGRTLDNVASATGCIAERSEESDGDAGTTFVQTGPALI